MFNQKPCECGCGCTLWLFAMEAKRVERARIFSPDKPLPLDWPGIFMWAVGLADVEVTLRWGRYAIVDHPVTVCSRSEYTRRLQQEGE